MKLELARTLAGVLTKAIATAEASGSEDVDLTDVLRAADDQARSELQAAIDQHKKAGTP